MSFEFEKLKLEGLVLVKPRIFTDSRGFFIECYKKKEFALAGIPVDFVQDNHSRSSKGVIRGFHYQRGAAAQGKLVRCISGAMLDVAVDIRRGSPAFGKWTSVELSAENAHMIYLPPGFAHAFLALTGTAEIIYKCTVEYSPEAEAGILWNDPDIGVDWPVSAPLQSAKDAALPRLRDAKL